MSRLTRKLLDLLLDRRSRNVRARPVSRRLNLESLEERAVPATANATGTITGFAFVDTNVNRVLDQGEFLASGVTINLSGTTTALHRAVNVNVITNANGAFTFEDVQPGIYKLGSNTPVFIHETTSASRLSAPPGVTVFAQVTVTGGQTVKQNVGFLGLAPAFVSQAEFLSNTPNPIVQVLTPGSGVAFASARANSAPTLSKTIPAVAAAENGTNAVDLAGFFTDPDITNSTVQINTNLGSFQVQLFDTTAPQTVANFFDYILAGDYNNDIFHRLAINTTGTGSTATSSKYVIQAGGFNYVNGTNGQKNTIVPLTTLPDVPNEFNSSRSNTAGTLAMAKLGSNPNSASSQFFVNLGNNSSNLDTQNGGFTVFGKIVGQTSTTSVASTVVNKLSNGTVVDESTFNSALNTLPVNSSAVKANDPNFPGDTTENQLEVIKSVQIIHRSEALTYSVVSNTNPNLVFTKLQDEHLTLSYAPNQTGSATITVKCTDEFGASVTSSFTVTVAASAPTATVAPSNSSPTLSDLTALKATVTPANTLGFTPTFTYTWTDIGPVGGNGSTAGPNGNGTLQVTSSTTATSDTLLAANVTGVQVTDQIKVSVATTANGIQSTTPATATATVAVTTTPATTVALNNNKPTLSDTITATATPTNADGDPVTLTYQWVDTTTNTAGPNGNGVLRTTTGTSATTDSLNLSQITGVNVGDTITLTVTPMSDGLPGNQVMATATVAQTTTPSVSVKVDKTSPTLNDKITATATPANVDGDPVTLTYQWTDTPPTTASNPSPTPRVIQTTSNTSSTTDVLDLTKVTGVNVGDTITVTVTPTSDLLTGNFVTATSTVAIDTPPVVDSVPITPTSPTTTSTLTAAPTGHDPDGDTVTFLYQWSIPGQGNVTGATSSTLNLTKLPTGFSVKAGTTVTVTVTPFDGAQDGSTFVQSIVV